VGRRSFLHEGVDDFGKGLSLALISSLSGLLLMGTGAEVFIIIRIMEPFWFLAAIVTMLPEAAVEAPENLGPTNQQERGQPT
jgi:hypothetical protein